MKADDVPTLGDIAPESFRKTGHEMIDWIAEYLTHPERVPVMARTRPGEVRGALPPAPPEAPVPLATQFRDFREILLPGITHWNHPAFFAYFGITGSMPGILGELLAAALNVNAMLWKTSPAATELEEVVLDWLRQGLGLPGEFTGVLMDTASSAALVAMTTARETLGLDIRQRGLAGRDDLPPLTAYCSQHAHSAVDKAAITLGIGLENLRKIPVDEDYRMLPGALEAAIGDDRAAGRRPFFVLATVGTTSTASVDPVPAIARICRRAGLWLHVDGAYGGMAALLPEKRWALEGAAEADSLVVNPHKWLFTPIDFSAFYTRREEAVRAAFSLVPEFLRTPEQDRVRNFMDYGIPLGRRMRALKLWMVFNSFGMEGLRARLRDHIRLGAWLAGEIDADPAFERMAPTHFSLVCLRWLAPGRPGVPTLGAARDEALNRLNETLLHRLNESGRLFLSHTVLDGRYTLRMAIGNIRTDQAAVEAAWRDIRETAAQLAREEA